MTQGAPGGRVGWRGVLAAALIAAALLAAYANSFAVPLLFDDYSAIVANPGIRHLWPAWAILAPPPNVLTAGRPVLNLSYAINYAFGGTAVGGYHAVNLALHFCAALVLLGIVRRTWETTGDDRRGSLLFALAAVSVWALHPLQTDAVTYITQRAEVLMGLFYLLTLYCFIRGDEASQEGGRRRPGGGSPAGDVARRRRDVGGHLWYASSVAACALGMASKEVMVTAPLAVLLYDRTFLSGGWREAWRRHGRVYAGLFATWIILACLLPGLGRRGAGFDQHISPWNYAVTECGAVLRYLRLAVWPRPLVFDYGDAVAAGVHGRIPEIAGALALVGLVIWALCRRPILGCLGAWVLLILAPTSTFVPLAGQPVAEHRMYLPLAALAAGLAWAAWKLAGRKGLAALLFLAAGLGFLTHRRNADYRSPAALWADTAAKRPESWRAHDELGTALDLAGHPAAALAEYFRALALRPDSADLENNLGHTLGELKRPEEALAHFERSLRLEPDSPEVRINLGFILLQAGRPADAAENFQRVLTRRPDSKRARDGLAATDTIIALGLRRDGKPGEAVEYYRRALQLRPDLFQVAGDLGMALAEAGRLGESEEQFRRMLVLRPRMALLHNDLGNVLVLEQKYAEAIAEYKIALRLQPGHPGAAQNLNYAEKALQVTQPRQ